MKKCIMLFALLSSFALANGPHKILEDRVENQAMVQKLVNSSTVDYDVDIYNNQMNFEVEIEGAIEPKLDYSQLSNKIVNIVKSETPNINEISIIVKFDPTVGNDKILYSKTYTIK